MNFSFINHKVRRELKLTCSQYIVLDALYQLVYASESQIADNVGLNINSVTEILEKLCESDIVDKDPDSEYYLTKQTRKELSGLEPVKPRPKKEKKSSELSEQVINLFNNVNGTRYDPKTYSNNIDSICRQNKSLTFVNFESVIKHKHITWGQDEKMSEYNRPATIFGSYQKFMKYLDDAKVYWDKVVKESSYVDVGR
jgi:uncharacterized phage protein (TIGR02220 family)